MLTCIQLHGLKRSWHSCPRQVNASNKNTPSMHHPQRRNVTTSMVGLRNVHIHKNLTEIVNHRDTAGKHRRRRSRKTNCLGNWHSDGYAAKCLALCSQYLDWFTGCQYAATGWGSMCETSFSVQQFVHHLNRSVIEIHCFIGLVVKVPASRVADPGSHSCLCWDFYRSSHTSDLKIDTPVASLPGVWHYTVSWLVGLASVFCDWVR